MDATTLNIGFLTDLLGSIISLLSVIIAFYSIILAFRFRSELGFSEQISNLPNFIGKNYWNREIVPPIMVKDVELQNLKDARALVAKEIKSTENGYAEDALNSFLAATVQLGTWQNKVAYQISLGLEQVGLNVLSGAHDLEAKVREDRELIRFHRLHGEWLAYATGIYMHNLWTGDSLKKLIDSLGGIEEIKHREKTIRQFIIRTKLIPKSTQRQIQEHFGKA
jgi:hypothetical protein